MMNTIANRIQLKVVYNEKGGGGGGRGREGGKCSQQFVIGLGPWRSRFVCRLILLSSLILICFRVRQVNINFLGNVLMNRQNAAIGPWFYFI
jgi:hypothetical protein